MGIPKANNSTDKSTRHEEVMEGEGDPSPSDKTQRHGLRTCANGVGYKLGLLNIHLDKDETRSMYPANEKGEERGRIRVKDHPLLRSARGG